MSPRPIFVVAGVGNGSGTGASAARVFSKAGYRVALVARNAEHVKKAAEDINKSGGEAAAFPVTVYNRQSFQDVFASIKKQWPDSAVRVALYNAAHGVWKPFLDVTEDEVQESLNTNILGGFGFSHAAISAFKELELNEIGKRGTLIFTGATASIRGNVTTSAFAAGKFGLRALSQSLAKEFGKQNIHVRSCIITDRSREFRNDTEWEKNEDVRLSPESIGKSYLALADQDRSALTWELDLRPAHEKW